MKCPFYIIVVFLFITLSCSKNKLNDTIDSTNDSIAVYMQKAENIKNSYEFRVLYTKKAVTLLLQQKNDSLNNDHLIQMAYNFYKLNSWYNLKSTSQKTLARTIKNNNYSLIGESYQWLGIYYQNVSVNDSAFYCFNKAKKTFDFLNDEKKLCNIYQNIGQGKYFVGDYVGYESSLVKALRIAKKLKLKREEYRIYIGLGISNNEQKNKKEAFYYYNKALELAKGNEDDGYNAVAFCLNNIGINHYFFGEIKEAIICYQKALKKKNLKSESPLIYCRLIDNLANAKLANKQYEGVYNMLNSTSLIRKKRNIFEGIIDNKLYLSEYFIKTNDTIKSMFYAQESLFFSKKFVSPIGALFSLKQLAKVDTQNALKYSQEYIRISDSMQQLERVNRNKFAKIAYETEEITTEKDQAIQHKWIFFGIAVLLFVIGAMVVLLLIKRAKLKELQFLQEQQKTNEEIYQLIQNQQSKIDEARHIEKKRIAQDLHDGIMNRLSSTRLNLHILNEKSTPEIIKKCLPFISGIQGIEKEIRNLSHDLNKDALFNKVSFVAVVESFIAEQKELFKGKCHLEIDPTINWEWLTSFQKINIFRILQEAFQNTNKHAHAQNFIVSFLKSENQLLLEIFDDGEGFSLKQKKKGIGLQNIYSRAKQCNGKVEIKSDIGTGTTLIITIPLNPIL